MLLTISSVIVLCSLLVIPQGIADTMFFRIGTEITFRINEKDNLSDNVVTQFTVTFGPLDTAVNNTVVNGKVYQWCEIAAVKQNGQTFTLRLLARGNSFPPADTQRYLFREGTDAFREYIHAVTGKAVLPNIVAPEQLFPQSSADNVNVSWLGHSYTAEFETFKTDAPFPALGEVRTIRLQPDVWVGVPSNSRVKDPTRRYDDSDYEMVRLTRENYTEMIQSGLNCLRVDAEQFEWIKDEPVFYWGIGGSDILFPETLFRSNYIGSNLFYDEPAVVTRDYTIRPRLEKEPEFRRSITPQIALEAFKEHFHKSATEGPPFVFTGGLQARQDVNLGTMDLSQRNLYTWETCAPSAAWQLTSEPLYGPQAIVFEPPGHIGTRRTLPEMNMTYGCQLSPNNPAHFTGIIFGFLRGGARASGKDWGVSVYGAVDRADAPFWLTHAYDLGATRFFYWDNYRSACVPYPEYLALTRHLQAHIQGRPERDIEQLKHLAEVVILLPPGYDLGHVQTGRGNLWGLSELNLERKNSHGIKYRQVMQNFFVEIERCLKLNVPFDLLWDHDGLKLDGYREIVRVLEDGNVEVTIEGDRSLHAGPRIPERYPGRPPQLRVELLKEGNGTSRVVGAIAKIVQGTAPIYYTPRVNRTGVYPNAIVLWELYGPNEEDYRILSGRSINTSATVKEATVEVRFTAMSPGTYRLRTATTDLAGRSSVDWKEFTVGQ